MYPFRKRESADKWLANATNIPEGRVRSCLDKAESSRGKWIPVLAFSYEVRCMTDGTYQVMVS